MIIVQLTVQQQEDLENEACKTLQAAQPGEAGKRQAPFAKFSYRTNTAEFQHVCKQMCVHLCWSSPPLSL